MAEPPTLKETSKDITNQLGARSTLLEGTSFAFKVLGASGALVTGIAKLAEWNDSISYVAATIAFISAVFVLVADRSASKSLADARLAIDKALEHETTAENGLRKFQATEIAYAAELDRLRHFQTARDAFRTILEDVVTSSEKVEEIFVLENMLKSARRPLFWLMAST